MLIAMIVSGSFATTAAIAIVLESWTVLRVSRGQLPFADLRTVTATADCVSKDPTWSISAPPCSSLGTAYNYPSLPARLLAPLGVDEGWTMVLGCVLVLLIAVAWFMLVFCALGEPLSIWRLTFLILAIFSPAAFLVVERGNYDSVIMFILVCCSSLYLLGRKELSALLLAFSVGLKFFSIGASLILLQDQRKRWVIFGAFVLLTASFVLLSYDELTYISERTPTTLTQSFGAAYLPLWVYENLALSARSTLGLDQFSSLEESLGIKAVGTLLFLSLLLILLWTTRAGASTKISHKSRLLWRSISADRVSSTFYLGGAGTFVVAYLLGTNFNYRLIFLVPVLTALARLPSREGFFLSMTVLLTLYVSTWAPASLAPIGALIMLVLVPYLALGVIRVAGNIWSRTK